jgi:hypothetical protein
MSTPVERPGLSQRYTGKQFKIITTRPATTPNFAAATGRFGHDQAL